MTMIAAADAPAACAYCGESGSGKFCSACGKERAIDRSSTHVLKDVLGVKAPPVRALLCTAWFAVARPATLSTRWAAGRRQGLASPIAMISTVTAITALAGLVLGNLSGHHDGAEPQDIALRDMIHVAPFLRAWFPAAYAGALAAPQAFADLFRKVGSWVVAFWPILFILPGYLSLAPWRKTSSHDALIVSAVETIFILIATGAYMSLHIVSPAAAASGLISTAFWIVVFAHTAFHIRHALATGWGYAIARPFLSALYFLVLIYIWVVGVLMLSLACWPLLAAR